MLNGWIWGTRLEIGYIYGDISPLYSDMSGITHRPNDVTWEGETPLSLTGTDYINPHSAERRIKLGSTNRTGWLFKYLFTRAKFSEKSVCPALCENFAYWTGHFCHRTYIFLFKEIKKVVPFLCVNLYSPAGFRKPDTLPGVIEYEYSQSAFLSLQRIFLFIGEFVIPGFLGWSTNNLAAS